MTEELSTRGRQVRLVAAAIVIGGLLYGTFWGSDHNFPFGPLHMYSRYYPATGIVTSTSVQATNADGVTRYVTQADTGIARGDIEGQLPEYEADPDLLANLAASFHHRHPLAPPFVSMRIVQKQWRLKDRALVDTTMVTLVSWQQR